MTQEQDERVAVVVEARTWRSTPYHGQARLKGVGVDCAQLPAAVYAAAGIIEEVQPVYSREWHLHRSEEQYVEWVLALGGREIAHKEAGADMPWLGAEPQAGDFGIWKFGRTFSHGAIFTASDTVVHAYIGVGVLEDPIHRHEDLRTRPARVFTLWPRA